MSERDSPSSTHRIAAILDATLGRSINHSQGYASGQQIRRVLESRLEKILARARQGIADNTPQLPYVEWLLDNVHVLRETLQQIEKNLPKTYYRDLPCVKDPHATAPRVTRVASLVSEATLYHGLPIDLARFEQFCESYQASAALKIGELWALPSMLRVELMTQICASAELGGRHEGDVDQPVEAEGLASVIAGGIRSLRAVSAFDWKGFVERLSRVDAILVQDPANAYACMDFETRDQYREKVELVAKLGRVSESDIANAALHFATAAQTKGADSRETHIGYYLVDHGRSALLRYTGASENWLRKTFAIHRRGRAIGYVLSLLVVAGGMSTFLAYWLLDSGVSLAAALLVASLSLFPTLSLSTGVINTLLAHWRAPAKLPKLDFSAKIPMEHRAVVAVPAMLTSRSSIDETTHTLELNYLGNVDPTLQFVLLTDFADASHQDMATDRQLLDYAEQRINQLNDRYETDANQPFVLLHRSRRWNDNNRLWMGWERKRGKLVEFNRYLRGDGEFEEQIGQLREPAQIRYVITLDADTMLPAGAAAQLVGTMAHPLNRPIVDANTRHIKHGYSIIQPRVEIDPATSNVSTFARTFAGDVTLDLYSRAVSDVYQDLFASGVFAGKGIYDVDAFSATVHGRLPDNRILSHDLLEGLHGRAGLATDIVLLEDYPPSLLAYLKRSHRWIRGDWQLLPWLLRRRPLANVAPFRPGLVGRWQLFDNLRRSLVAAAIVALFSIGWILLPVNFWTWTALVMLTPGLPLFLRAMSAFHTNTWRWGTTQSSLRNIFDSAGSDLSRWFLMLAFLPLEALIAMDAILRTLYRVFVSHKNLLEWSSAAEVARAMAETQSEAGYWKNLASGPIWALLNAAAMFVMQPESLTASMPILTLWLLSPAIAFHIRDKPRQPLVSLPAADRMYLRKVARRTWRFFERYVGPESHWLPPDNVQFETTSIVADRTSPTNIGFGLLSVVSAYDFGFIGLHQTLFNLNQSLDVIARLETYRGHLYNWYSLQDCRPLTPRYVSTVDSGNLAAALIVVSQALREIASSTLPRSAALDGIRDDLGLIHDILKNADEQSRMELSAALQEVERTIDTGLADGRSFADIIDQLADGQADTVTSALLHVLTRESSTWSDDEIESLRDHVQSFCRRVKSAQAETQRFFPWAAPLAKLTRVPADSTLHKVLNRVRTDINYATNLSGLRDQLTSADRQIGEFQKLQSHEDELLPSDIQSELRALRADFIEGVETIEQLLDTIGDTTHKIELLIHQMDFSFLYDDNRHLFHVGYRVDAGEMDASYYDLLASEARLASFVAIAKGDVPPKHWLHLGRPLTSIRGLRMLLSWSATSFEYLMPRLFMLTPRFGLLYQSCRGAVKQQRRFARKFHTPWGISESSYYHFDQQGFYQYQAFGVPRLGLKWDQGERLVISSYASFLALPFKTMEVVKNAREFEALGGGGDCGLYEALDFGPTDRSTLRQPKVVKSYMTHHQGMTLTAIANCLLDDRNIERFHRDPRIASVEHLLHEQLPKRAQTQPLEAFRPPMKQDISAAAPVQTWLIDDVEDSVGLLGNAHLTCRIAAQGGGDLKWRGMSVTQWRPRQDGAAGGSCIYVKDLDSNTLTRLGTDVTRDGSKPIWAPHCVELRDTRHSLLVRNQIFVAPFADVEIRKLSITNDSDRSRRLMLCSYSEPVLTEPQSHARHPAFSKMFVRHEYLDDHEALVFRRRQRSPSEPALCFAHKAVAQVDCEASTYFEVDRQRFLGRNGDNRRPAALRAETPTLTCQAGTTLDPICAFAITIEVAAGTTVQCAFLTAVGSDDATILRNIDQFASLEKINWTLEEARLHAIQELAQLDVASIDYRRGFNLLAAAMWPPRPTNEYAVQLSNVWEAQTDLWRHGISGDRPIITAVFRHAEDLPDLETLIRAMTVCRLRDVVADVVFLDASTDGYAQPSFDRVHALIDKYLDRYIATRRSKTFVLSARDLSAGERGALLASSRLFFDLSRGPWQQQLSEWRQAVPPVPIFLPQPSAPVQRDRINPVQRPERLLYDNEFGGIDSADYRYGSNVRNGDYTIYLTDGESTPSPWCNVLANRYFGTLLSESGSACSWYRNSGEYALTPWNNDAVLDRTGEALYVRDEETGLFWSPMPGPARDKQPYLIKHRIGSSTYAHNSEGLEQTTTVFVDPVEPIKIVKLRFRNLWPRARRLTVTYAAEWRLGSSFAGGGLHLAPDQDLESDTLLVRNSFSRLDTGRTAFLCSNLPAHGVTTDGVEFLGPDRSWKKPAGLTAIGPSQYVGPCAYPVAVYQVHIALAEGESCELHFALGIGDDRDAAVELAQRSRRTGYADHRLAAQRSAWAELLDPVNVNTPDTALNVMLNRWLPYQLISSRLWGRLGFYQASGGYGFRDQLQDVLALLQLKPSIARDHILGAASRQFEEGDVLHWWHEEPLRGVRTRCSDDLLWLPYVVCEYTDVTGDDSIWQEKVPYLCALPLAEDEEERYAEFRHGGELGSIYDHCCRALTCRMLLGEHGLPLIGSGDWNDGFSRVGIEGRGESVWLAWFLIEICRRFEPICTAKGDAGRAEMLHEFSATLQKNIERHAWSGDRYIRAYFDDGTPLGTPETSECAIDLNAQTWAIFDGEDDARKQQSFDAINKYLVDEQHHLIKLLTPPFDRSEPDPGYIRSYPPGVRENGGQYNHAAVWALSAAVQGGHKEHALRWLNWLNPLKRSDRRATCERYAIEPYVLAADIYGEAPFAGRGGWSWYTGAAAWLYRVTLEQVLGIRRLANQLFVDPCLPADWHQFEVAIKYRQSQYQVIVHEPSQMNSESIVFSENDRLLPGVSLTMLENGEHLVHVFPNAEFYEQWLSERDTPSQTNGG